MNKGLIVGIAVIFAFALIFFGFFAFRRRYRRKLNIERGLSMVAFKIHLPPLSEDIDSKDKDSRDLVEANIAQASVLYNLLSSINEKQSWKTRYKGQPYLSFEIVAQGGFITFYALAPRDMAAFLRQAVISAYKGARVERVEDYNLFRSDVDWQDMAGSELHLKNNFAYPIATYVVTRQDIMKSLLGAFSELKSGDGAAIQILIRPAGDNWHQKAKKEAKNKSESKSSNLFKDIALGAIKPPEESSSQPSSLNNLDKKLVEAIENKVSQPGFECFFRVLVCVEDRSQLSVLNSNLLATFSLLDSPHSNGFKSQEIKTNKMQQFVKDFYLRDFPQHVQHNVLSTDELSTIFHLPNQSNIPTSQLERQTSKQVDAPRNFPEDGLILGHNFFRGETRAIILGDEDRMRHTYVIGQTGTGKSVFLENLALQDIRDGKGFAFVDPHGDTAARILGMIPKDQLDNVIYFNPGNMEYPMGLNIFEHQNVDQQDFLIQEAITMLYKLYDPTRSGIIGPLYEHMFRNAAKLIMADPRGGTFIDIPKLFNDRALVEEKLRYVKDQTVIDFWRKEIIDSSRSSEFGQVKSWFVSKFSAFLSNTMMRHIIGQNKSFADLRQIMDQGKILIINLSYGLTGELNMKLLGMLFVTKFQMAAMSRADLPGSERTNFTLYVDEFQNFATDSFANILSAARKYGLALVVANQHTTQLEEGVRDAVYGNVGTAISFRSSANDADDLIKQFYSPQFELNDLTRLPLGETVVRTLVNGVPTEPFNMKTQPPSSDFSYENKTANENILLSRYGRPRKEVEEEIYQRLGVQKLAPKSDDPMKLSPVDFMDNWLKRKESLKRDLSQKYKSVSSELEDRQRYHKALEAKEAKLKEEINNLRSEEDKQGKSNPQA